MSENRPKESRLKDLRTPLGLLLLFWALAVLLWQTKRNIFYLLNFGYIGTALAVGLGLYILLPRQRKPTGRRVTQLLVGIYMLGFLGLLLKENMQLEGFFFYLLKGVFAGSVIHYVVAKIVGPVFFGRGFCGWACWTAMVLDFLPYKRSSGRQKARWEKIRYLHFAVSLCLVGILWFIFSYHSAGRNAGLVWLAVGNTLYYASAIPLALTLKDNRAFCKYLCPVTTLLKFFSRFALLKIGGDSAACTQCGACSKVCPMNIDVMSYVKNGERVLSTECVLCFTCTTACPADILDGSVKVDVGGKELLKRVQPKTVIPADPVS